MISIPSIAPKLRRNREGIWISASAGRVSYPEHGHDACYAVEEKSFWFEHRNRCILSVMMAFPPEGAVFDIGGGNGFVSLALGRAGFDAVLVEPGPRGASHAKARGLETVIRATTESAGFRPGSLPAVGLFDVIEHIRDDAAFLKSIRNLMAEGGRVYMTAPAYPGLWSDEDKAAGHFRRYSLKELEAAAVNAGFEVEFSSHIFRFLAIPIALFRSLPYKLGLSGPGGKSLSQKDVQRDHVAGTGILKNATEFLLRSEPARLEAKKPMGFGGSCLVVAKKRAGHL